MANAAVALAAHDECFVFLSGQSQKGKPVRAENRLWKKIRLVFGTPLGASRYLALTSLPDPHPCDEGGTKWLVSDSARELPWDSKALEVLFAICQISGQKVPCLVTFVSVTNCHSNLHASAMDRKKVH